MLVIVTLGELNSHNQRVTARGLINWQVILCMVAAAFGFGALGRILAWVGAWVGGRIGGEKAEWVFVLSPLASPQDAKTASQRATGKAALESFDHHPATPI